MIWLADVVVILGTLMTTAAVAGIFRFSDRMLQIHAAAKGVGFGAGLTACVGLLSGDAAHAAKSVLVVIALLTTAPLGSHVLARLEWHSRRSSR